MLLRTFALITLLGVSPLSLQEFVRPADWTKAVEPFRIADDLWYVGSAELTAFLLTSPDGHVLIDAPLEENVGMVLANVRALGFDPADIRVQLASHGHFDHVGGIAAIVAAAGSELILSEADADLIADGGASDDLLGDTATYPAATATRTVAHLETVTVGPIELTAHLTPGHTRGCTTWSGTATIGGEALEFVSVCSLTVLPGTRLLGSAPSYPGIARDFCASVEHLESLAPDLFLASHASFIRLDGKLEALRAGEPRAFVDPEGYRRWVARARERIEQELARQGEPGGCAAVLER